MTDQGQQQTGAGPDRGNPQDRPGSRVPPPEQPEEGQQPRLANPSAAIRIVVFVTVLGVLLLSGAASLQIFFRQERQLAEARDSITEHQQAITDLDRRARQWDDPAYVEQQARERFGWVMPGETGYRVIGPDGKPIEGARLDSTRSDQEIPAADAWWMKLWSSTRTADRPLPTDVPVGEPLPEASPTPTMGTSSGPSSSPTP